MTSTAVPHPPPDVAGVEAWVERHLAGLYSGPLEASPRFRGGQRAADSALAAFDVGGYAQRRSEVFPVSRRGASGLSPYIRHGLLQLRTVWDAVAGGPAADVRKFRDELLWQEYARHLYARMGRATSQALRFTRPPPTDVGPVWDDEMACTTAARNELQSDGWLVNQVRMWMASHWTVRRRHDWAEGEDWMYRHLLDGSRAANRLGWQWTGGLATGKPYGFSRWQVNKRAPGLCASCSLRDRCPIEDWPSSDAMQPLDPDPLLRSDPDVQTTAGPVEPVSYGDPDSVWLTAESLGAADPALAAHPDRLVVFVFDAPLLRRLQLAAKRLAFLAECLTDLSSRRDLEVHVGEPTEVLATRRPAVTFAPVPGWQRRASRIDVAEVHPWPWLVRPGTGSVASFSAWRKTIR